MNIITGEYYGKETTKRETSKVFEDDLRFEGRDILYNRLNMQFLKYWDIIHSYETFLRKV